MSPKRWTFFSKDFYFCFNSSYYEIGFDLLFEKIWRKEGPLKFVFSFTASTVAKPDTLA